MIQSGLQLLFLLSNRLIIATKTLANLPVIHHAALFDTSPILSKSQKTALASAVWKLEHTGIRYPISIITWWLPSGVLMHTQYVDKLLLSTKDIVHLRRIPEDKSVQ